jgi:hypothetical protein
LYSPYVCLLNTVLIRNKAKETTSNNLFVRDLKMKYNIYDRGIWHGETITNPDIFVPVPPNIPTQPFPIPEKNLVSTAFEVFGTDVLQLNENGVFEILETGTASRYGRLAGISEQLGRYQYMYYSEDGKWIPLDAEEKEAVTIVPLAADQSGTPRYEGFISVGAYQYPFDQPDANLPVEKEDCKITAFAGALSVQTSRPALLEVYMPSGRLLFRKTLPEGLATLPLSPGLYIVKADRAVKKVIVN